MGKPDFKRTKLTLLKDAQDATIHIADYDVERDGYHFLVEKVRGFRNFTKQNKGKEKVLSHPVTHIFPVPKTTTR